VQRVLAVGKECVVVLPGCALRLHFGMSGSHRVRPVSSVAGAPAGRKQLVLTVEFESVAVDFFDSTAGVQTLGYVRTLEERSHRDVVAVNFNRQSVVDRLHGDNRPACDALMDQVTYPGVGNIIKCEGLWEAAIDPIVPLSQLPLRRLELLVDLCRSFAQRWMEACRRSKPMAKSIYSRVHCSSCKSAVQLVRLQPTTPPTATRPLLATFNAIACVIVAHAVWIPAGLAAACPAGTTHRGVGGGSAVDVQTLHTAESCDETRLQGVRRTVAHRLDPTAAAGKPGCPCHPRTEN
jgi:hypothetical protein